MTSPEKPEHDADRHLAIEEVRRIAELIICYGTLREDMHQRVLDSDIETAIEAMIVDTAPGAFDFKKMSEPVDNLWLQLDDSGKFQPHYVAVRDRYALARTTLWGQGLEDAILATPERGVFEEQWFGPVILPDEWAARMVRDFVEASDDVVALGIELITPPLELTEPLAELVELAAAVDSLLGTDDPMETVTVHRSMFPGYRMAAPLAP